MTLDLVRAAVEGLPVAAREEHGRVVVDVPREHWVGAVAAVAARVAGGVDLLTAVDEGDRGVRVVLHLWTAPHSVLLVTACPAHDLAVPSLTGVLPGADWSERHAAEMFGLDFPGHPGLARLLLPAGFQGHPLRKDFVLAPRAVQPWPGAVEPGESPRRRSRRGARAPGVPEPGTWGPA